MHTDVVIMDDEQRQESHDPGGVVVTPAYILLVERKLCLQGAICDVIVADPDFELAAACASKYEALQVIETIPLDIALVSLNLADGSGLDIVRALKKFQPRCEVLVMGTADDKEDIFSSMQAGACGCLLKENLMLPERVRGNSIVIGLAFCRMLGNLPAVNEASGYKKDQTSGMSTMQGNVLRCVASGQSNKEIARTLVMSSYNVDYHLRCLRRRFLVHNRVQLSRAATTFLDSRRTPYAA
jgi:DNA-binding NarL/FixJ family response regulator